MMRVLLIAPLDVSFEDVEMLSALKGRGWKVEFDRTPQHGWETPGELQRRLGISATLFCRKVQKHNCPPFEVERTPYRIIRLQATPELEAFLKPLQRPAPFTVVKQRRVA